MLLYRVIPVFLLTAFLCSGAPAQTRSVDSLKNIIRSQVPDKEKLDAIFHLSDLSIEADSLLPFVKIAETITTTAGTREEKSLTALCRAFYYLRKNIVDSSLDIITNLLKQCTGKKDNEALCLRLSFALSKAYDRGNLYTKALAQLNTVIELAKSQKDTLIQIQAETGIGWVLIELAQYPEALKWLLKALHTSSDKRFYKNYGALYSNIASAYNSLGKPDSALFYIDIAIRDARENENLLFLATALSMEAKIFTDNGRAKLAEIPLNEAVEIRKQLKDPFYIVYDMSNLASYYAANGQAQKGIALCEEGIKLAKENKLSSQLLLIYEALAKNYKAAGNTPEYSHTLEQIVFLKDSFNNINSGKLLADLQANNEERKSEKLINEQQLNLAKKNYWLFGSALFAMMAGIIAWLLFRNYRRKQRMKMEAALAEEKRMAASAVAEAEEQERKRIASDLHDNLGAYAASMASNLGYIDIQEADDATKNAFKELSNNSNAIISQLNDTIWVLKKDSLSLTAISDRLKTFISRIQKSYPQIKIEVNERIETDYRLPSSQAFQLYRVLQEAVNNSLKHSRGRSIIVSISAGERWMATVEDDGVGISEPVSDSGQGNGLANMKERSSEAGWQINWKVNQYGGTTVEISPTTN